MIGTSRKRFLGGDVHERLPGTIATNVLALERGASVFRVHDVAPRQTRAGPAAATLGERWLTPSASEGADVPDEGLEDSLRA